jgi:hypothetical protein
MVPLVLVSCVFASFSLGPLIGHDQWLMSQDVWTTTNSAQWVANGAIGTVYQANPWYTALPGFLAVYAPVVMLGTHLGLVVGYPIPLAHPTMWLLTGPFFFLCASTTVPAVDYLADSLGVPSRRRRVLAFGIALLIAIPTAGFAGHPEDLLALSLVCLSLSLHFRGRPGASAACLSLSILMQTWAGLVLPVLMFANPSRTRMRFGLRAAALPALVGLLLLALDFPHASVDLLGQPMPGRGQHLPWWHIAGHVRVSLGNTTSTVVSGSGIRSLAVITAVAVGFAIRKNPSPRLIMAASAVALFARGIFETEYWPYYLAPAAVLLALLGADSTRGRARGFSIVLAGAFLLYANSAFAYAGWSYPDMLALAVVLGSGVGCLGAALGLPRAFRHRFPSWTVMSNMHRTRTQTS